MKSWIASALALITLATPTPSQDLSPAHSGFRPLFNGRDLAGWRGRPQLDPAVESAMDPADLAAQQAQWNRDMTAHWRVEDAAIVNDGDGPFLTTEASFGDFEFVLEYRTVALADSGIYLRACPQVQIWDTTEAGGKWNHGADKGSGSLWNNQVHPRFPLQFADRPFGEWNSLRIRMVGSRVTVWMNGCLVVRHTVLENFFDRTRPVPERGPIQLQTHGGEIRWRNLAIREIDPLEANRLLLEQDAEGYDPVFNGKDLAGWKGDTAGYEVVDGSIACRKGSGGNLFTEAILGDFVARLEFLLPPGGNNGLAIRYPGEGDPAYVALCEVQVLDDSHKKYLDLKPWQFHGSVYGMAPSTRGYLRPVGTWNVEEVRVQGSRITVELNGFIINDVDLAAIETPLSGREHPGRTRTEGHFGFAGHGDPVRFRNILIKSLR